MVHRKLTSTVDHKVSLLKNLVTNVIEHESITTTHAKAKEAQTAVERLITAAKRLQLRETAPDHNRRRQLLQNRFYKQNELFPKVMGDLVPRYAQFNGGYTRILRLEPRVGDNAPQSILELVGGRRDMRQALTAKAVARAAAVGEPLSRVTRRNVKKLGRTPESREAFEAEVAAMREKYFADIEAPAVSVAEMVKKRAPIEMRPNPRA